SDLVVVGLAGLGTCGREGLAQAGRLIACDGPDLDIGGATRGRLDLEADDADQAFEGSLVDVDRLDPRVGDDTLLLLDDAGADHQLARGEGVPEVPPLGQTAETGEDGDDGGDADVDELGPALTHVAGDQDEG